MATKPRDSALATFQMLSCLAFLAVTVPLGLIFDIHRASAYSDAYGGPLRVASVEFAWPVYLCVAIGAIWAINATWTWTDAPDRKEHDKDPGVDWYSE